eukprot:Partr_v1_DN26181_c1_g1_i3_m10417 putative Translocator protein
MVDFQSLAVSVTLPVVGGYLSSWNNRKAVATWYNDIRKPSITPPNSAYPVVWTSLYALMGYAFYRVLSRLPLTVHNVPPLQAFVTAQPQSAVPWYILQLALNYAWCPLFFGKRRFLAASIDSAVLLLALVPTTVSFWRVDKVAGQLMLPYIGWVGLATYCTAWIWANNPEMDNDTPQPARK